MVNMVYKCWLSSTNNIHRHYIRFYVTQAYNSDICDTTPNSSISLQPKNVSKNIRSNIKGNEVHTVEMQNQFSELKNESTDDNFRKNDLNIQMLSKSLYNQLFKSRNVHKDKKLIDRALFELKKHGLPGSLHRLPDVDLQLPELFSDDIVEHFYMIGEQQSSLYRILLNKLIEPIPEMPNNWNYTLGWTKYVKGKQPVFVDYPDEDAFVFDVETCCKAGELPTIATAVSGTAWYSWVSKELIQGNSFVGKHNYTTNHLIPLESGLKIKGRRLEDSFLKPKIVVGHNVSFDRARVKEQYWLERTGLRFMDTMSLHVCISGVTSYQKSLLKSGDCNSDWVQQSSLNNLSAVHELYCGTGITKEERNIFVTGTYEDITNNFQSLMTYCAKDVQATHNILTHLWPEFLSRFPHPVTLAGMLELSNCYLPVNNNWNRYLEDAQQSYDDLDIERKVLLAQEADKACQLLHGEQYKNNLWLWDADWEVKQFKLKKEKKVSKKKCAEESDSNLKQFDNILAERIKDIDEYDMAKQIKMETKFVPLISMTKRLRKKIPHLTGYPSWYRELCTPYSDEWKPGPHLISTSMKITPKLLSLSWKSMPLHYIRGQGWGYVVPFKTNISLPEEETLIFPLEKLNEYYQTIKTENQIEINVNISQQLLADSVEKSATGFLYRRKNKHPDREIENDFENNKLGETCGLIKLPHKDGDNLNVGNPLAKDFINAFTDIGIKGNCKTAKIIEISRNLSYWKNNQERIKNQIVVWLEKGDLPLVLSDGNRYGAILPQVVICGTLTRRATERTWMTASNITDERVGSELRSMVQAPEHYSLVGADVDSQELWIASLIGDAYFANEHGCTAFGWMTISGEKADGTDMHSMTAKTMGILRSNAKIINYARIYGAGQYFSERLLKQFIPHITSSSAKEKTMKMFQTTKGKRLFQLKPGILTDQKQRSFYRYNAQQLCRLYGKSVDELFDKPKWVGGSESAMFNRLEEIAGSPEPVTPFLQCRLSKALEPMVTSDDKFIPTRINWVVQSGAVDFLHLMLVCMRWLVHPSVRFCLSFHDEVRYLVPEKHKYQTALALHVTNLLTRAFCVRKLGMVDLPQSVAFFTSVEVDRVLRKEAMNDCKTPSNPHGLSKGYNIKLGESLDILNAIEKAHGIIGNQKPTSKNIKNKGKDVNQHEKEICNK